MQQRLRRGLELELIRDDLLAGLELERIVAIKECVQNFPFAIGKVDADQAGRSAVRQISVIELRSLREVKDPATVQILQESVNAVDPDRA